MEERLAAHLLAQLPGVFTHRPDAAAVMPRRTVAQGGSAVDHNQGVDDRSLINVGVLHAEKLVNMFGPTYVFAVEVAKAGVASGP
jgi:hypothetical protein